MASEPGRRALIIAVDDYSDGRLRKLRAPGVDAEELARVLGSHEIGQFDVEVLRNEGEGSTRRRLAKFLAEAALDDVLVLHLSCHGLKDDDGELYFAAHDTEIDNLEATGISAQWVNRQIARSRSRQIVLLLDCCYSGAFSRGSLAKAGDGVELKDRFDGRGCVILTASNSMEYAFEGDVISGRATPSHFTSAVVEGLETGLADRDADSLVSVDELYDFVFERVRALTPNQTPSKWALGVEGDVYIARNPVPPPVQPAELPPDLRDALAQGGSLARVGAVGELVELLGSSDRRMSEAARLALLTLADDDSRRVATAAESALASLVMTTAESSSSPLSPTRGSTVSSSSPESPGSDHAAPVAASKEMRLLLDELEPGEHIETLSSAALGQLHGGLLAVTNCRLLFFWSLVVVKQRSWELASFRHAEAKTGILSHAWGAKLILHGTSEKVVFSEVQPRERAVEIAQLINERRKA